MDIIARIAGQSCEGAKILDIGCGSGDVTAEILKHNGNASFCMVDYSQEMVALSRDRFADNGNIRVLQHDLNNGLPEAVLMGEYDAVVSCFSLHHIEYEKRIKLYADINKVLKKGSFFINGDMFRGDSPRMNGWEFDNWIAWMVTGIKEHLGEEHTFDEVKARQLKSFEKMGDKPGTIWDMYRDLMAAGFNRVDCMHKILNLAIIVAEK